MSAKGNRALVRLEVLPGARERPRLGTERGLILCMDEDFDAPLEEFENSVECGCSPSRPRVAYVLMAEFVEVIGRKSKPLS